MDNIKSLFSEKPNNQKNQEEEFTSLYEEYFIPIFRYIYARILNKEEAEDMAQGVFMRVYRNFETLKTGKTRSLAYFIVAAKNALTDKYRKVNHEYLVTEENLEFFNNIPDQNKFAIDLLKQSDNKEMIDMTLKILPENQREILILKFYKDLSNKEISIILDKKEVSIRKMQSRALKTLKNYFTMHKELCIL